MQKNKLIHFSGNTFNAVQLPEVIDLIEYWIKNEPQKSHWIVATGMHGIVQAHKHADFKYILNTADLFVPDGIGLVWVANLKGFHIKRRVPGPDIIKRFLEISPEKNYKSFLYGDTEETLQKVTEKFSQVKIASLSPPFKKLSQEETDAMIKTINDAKPDVLWVGLGLPKQETWIYQNREKLKVPVIVGVGAAFKFLAGSVKRAPAWMGNLGLEWLWRLFREPKLVWKRVFLDGPVFFWLIFQDMTKIKN